MTANEFCRPSGSPTPAKLDADPPDAIRVDRDPENIHGVFDCADSADPADRCWSRASQAGARATGNHATSTVRVADRSSVFIPGHSLILGLLRLRANGG